MRVAETATEDRVRAPSSAVRTAGSTPATGASPEIEVLPEIEQGSDGWFEIRRGIPTASEFGSILAEGERRMRTRYLHRLAGEIMSERLSETYRNDAMDRGNAIEPELREQYAATRFGSVVRVGFVRRRLPSGRWVGGSPDALVDDDGVLEIKSHKPEILIPILERGVPPLGDYRAQCQGLLWVTGRAWCDVRLGYYGHPTATFRFERDETYIRTLASAVEVFDYDLNELVKRLRRLR